MEQKTFFLQKVRNLVEIIGWVCVAVLTAKGLLSFWEETPVRAAQEYSLLGMTSESASVPLYLDYEGYLTDMDGAPLTGYFTVTLRIYNDVAAAIGNELWAEVHPNVPVRDGRFSVLLGNNTALPESLFDLPDRFIGATVAPFDELVPRQRLASVPYAVHADHAVSLIASDGSPIDVVFVDEIGNVGVGTTTPAFKLDVSGGTHLGGDLDVAGNVQFQGNLDVSGTSTIGPHFIEPVVVASGTEAIPWTTFDASAYIPVNASAVILEAEGSMYEANQWSWIRIRRDATSPNYLLLRGKGGGIDYPAWGSQGFFPHNNRTFQFTVETGFNEGFVIRLIGYFK